MSDSSDTKGLLNVIHVLLFFASSLSLSNFIRKRQERRSNDLVPKTPNRYINSKTILNLLYYN